jgi:hypothetical protein
MDKPIRAYVILPVGGLLQDDMVSMLKNCKAINDQLEVIEIDPERNPNEVNKLIGKYNVLRDATGLALGVLLVSDPDGPQEQNSFVKADDLEDMTSGRGEGRAFKGEQALYTALREFREGKKKVTIYFTQDSGELSIDEMAVRSRRDVPPNRSAVALKTKLEQAGYQVKPLMLGERELSSNTGPTVPDDALVVIVADPLKMTPEKASVLDAYLKRPKKDAVEPGKLIVLADVHYGPDGKVLPTGLEGLLQNCSVQIGQNVLLAITRGDPTAIPVALSQRTTDPDIVQSIYGLLTANDVEFSETRSVTALPGGGAFEAKGLLYASSGLQVSGPQGRMPAVWPEEKQISDPRKYVQENFENREFLKKMKQEPLAVAVTVRERSLDQPPPNPMGQPPQTKPGAPRLVIFGDASFAADAAGQQNEAGFNLILTALAWIRGKPELAVDVPPKERRAYHLVMTRDALSRVLYLPVLWILLAIIATGIGVGILRRR